MTKKAFRICLAATAAVERSVTVCNEQPGRGCPAEYDPHAPILAIGQQTELGGALCVAATSGITCTAAAGAGNGKGFTINQQEVVVLAPVATPAALTPAVASTAASHSCGALPGGPAPHTVTIVNGPLSCAQARSVAKSYTREAKFHGPPQGPRSAQYVTVPGGWRCSVIEQRGALCARGRSRSHPRELIGFVLD